MLDAHAYCADQVRDGDRDRYLTALLAPPERRKALLALYAFNLELAKAAEVASEPMLAEIRLTWWMEAVRELYAGAPRRHMVIEALADAGLPARVERSDLETLIEVRMEDLAPERFARLEQLCTFAEDSAGHLSGLALACLREADGDIAAAARDVGSAAALVGLMRTLPHCARARRLYLPTEGLRRCGVTPEQVYAGREREAVRALVAQVLSEAERRLEAVRRRLPRPPRWSLPVLLLAEPARLYLRGLRRQGCDPFVREVCLGRVTAPLALAWRHWCGRL